MRPWFAPGQWNIDGASDFTADLRVAGNAFEATNTKLVVTNLRAVSPDWNINESRIEFAGDARWNGATGELAANSAQLVSSTVAVAAKGVHYGGNQPAQTIYPAQPRSEPTWPDSPRGAARPLNRPNTNPAANSPATSASPNKRPHHRRDQRDGSKRRSWPH